MASKKGSKAAKRLQARRRDYTVTTADTKKNWSGYHRPGSNKK